MIISRPEFVGLGAQEALRVALKKGLHVQFDAREFPAIPGRIYLLTADGIVREAFEVKG